MTTNKVHDPKNTECLRNDKRATFLSCTCPTPTSVTGDEWVGELGERFSPIWERLHATKRDGAEWQNEIEDFIRNLLSTQRTHIKQALLGRVEGMEWKENTSNDTPTTAYTSETHRNNGYNNGIKDAKLIINEELA